MKLRHFFPAPVIGAVIVSGALALAAQSADQKVVDQRLHDDTLGGWEQPYLWIGIGAGDTVAEWNDWHDHKIVADLRIGNSNWIAWLGYWQKQPRFSRFAGFNPAFDGLFRRERSFGKSQNPSESVSHNGGIRCRRR